MTNVQVKINCLTSVSVLRMASAKAIAPRSPAMCTIYTPALLVCPNQRTPTYAESSSLSSYDEHG